MSTQVLRGSLEPLALIDVLAYLGRSGESGVLNVGQGEIQKAIIIHDGMVIFARSNQAQDRLGDILLSENQISQEEYERATALIYEKNYRHGRALIEIGAISPKVLWRAIQKQIQAIVWSVLPMETGSFEFTRQAIKHKESITVQLPILDLVVDIIRSMEGHEIFLGRFADKEEIYIRSRQVPAPAVGLEPYESYILALVNGKHSLGTICQISEIGEIESMRVLYLLLSMGLIRPLAGLPEEVPETLVEAADEGPPLNLAPDEDAEESLDPSEGGVPGEGNSADSAISQNIRRYNRIFKYLDSYLGERVGSMGHALLTKYFENSRSIHAGIFAGVELHDDGSLDEFLIEANFESLGLDETHRVMALGEAMDEYFYAGILAVKKLLGAEHEALVLNHIGGLNEHGS